MPASGVNSALAFALIQPLLLQGKPMTWKHEGSRHERGYGWQWDKLRKRIMARDRYLCQPCERHGIVEKATQVDHITPKAKDGTDDPDNLQAICTPCHKAKTKAETSGKVRIGADGWPI